jgi:hypothetical protein
VATADSVADVDDQLFGEVEKANTSEAYEYYLDEVPQGRHVLIARFRLKMLRARGSPAPAPSPQQSGQREERYRDEGRIKVDARIVHGAPHGWFLPGNGKVEWFQDYEDGPEMVVVPAGSFVMGSPEEEPGRQADESPQHNVTIAKPFAIARCAVTRGQFGAFVNKTEGGAFVWKGDDNHPVVRVAWDDAKAYVAWLSSQTHCDYRCRQSPRQAPLGLPHQNVERPEHRAPRRWGESRRPPRNRFD